MGFVRVWRSPPFVEVVSFVTVLCQVERRNRSAHIGRLIVSITLFAGNHPFDGAAFQVDQAIFADSEEGDGGAG